MACLEALFDNFHGPKIASAPANGVFEKHLDIFHDSCKIHLKSSHVLSQNQQKSSHGSFKTS